MELAETGALPVVLEVDLERSRRGLESQLARPLDGVPVLARTVDRLLAAALRPTIVVGRRDATAARELIGDRPVEWFEHDSPDVARRELRRRGRRWGKDGWRGGIDQSTFLCEQGNPHALAALCRDRRWERVLVAPADAPFVDPALLREIDEADRKRPHNRLYISTAPPGLAGDVLHIEALDALAANELTVGDLLRFRIDDDNTQWEQAGILHPFAEELSRVRARFTVDSRRAFRRAEALLEHVGATASASDVAAALETVAVRDAFRGPVPEELVVTPSDSTALFDQAVWPRILESFAHSDELLLTLRHCASNGGGATERFGGSRGAERVVEARDAGALGVHLALSGSAVSGGGVSQLAPTVARLGDALDAITIDLRGEEDVASSPAWDGVEMLLDLREASTPFVVLALPLDERHLQSWESFYDAWYERVDALLFTSPEGPRGEVASSALGVFTPPERFACSRLEVQMRVEADGRVPLCARDPEGEVPMGSVVEHSVAEVWQGSAFARARDAHHRSAWDEFGHCGPCRSWCRFD